MKKIMTVASILFLNLFTTAYTAKLADYGEDPYIMQAPQEIIDVAQKAVELVGFEGIYEVVIPKKSMLNINPWTKFMDPTINSITQHPCVIINPKFFNELTPDQQLFLMSRAFMLLKQGFIPLSAKVVPWCYTVLSFSATGLLYYALGTTRLAGHSYPWLSRGLVAFATVAISNYLVVKKPHDALFLHLAKNHTKRINELVVQKTQNRDAAISALEYMDSIIKADIQSGETYAAGLETRFEEYANALRNTQ